MSFPADVIDHYLSQLVAQSIANSKNSSRIPRIEPPHLEPKSRDHNTWPSSHKSNLQNCVTIMIFVFNKIWNEIHMEPKTQSKELDIT